MVDSINIPYSQERCDPVIAGHDLTVALIQVVFSKELHFIKSRKITYLLGSLLVSQELYIET